jgi:hypothetical protein
MNGITIEQGTPLTFLLNAQFQHTRGVTEHISLLLSRVVSIAFDNQPGLLQNTLPVRYTGVVFGKAFVACIYVFLRTRNFQLGTIFKQCRQKRSQL